MRARLRPGVLAEEVVLLGGGERGVAVGRADHAELVGIDAELRFELEAGLQRGTRIFALQHLGLLRFAEVEVALVPQLVAGELVVGREVGMRLAVALDLRRLVERLPAGACLGVFRGQRLAGRGIGLRREHPAVREIAVVRDGQNPSTGLVLIGLEMLPQILRSRAALRRIGRERKGLARLVAAVAVDHDTMQIVAGRHLRGPLIADEGGEASRLIVFFRRGDDLVPGRAVTI